MAAADPNDNDNDNGGFGFENWKEQYIAKGKKKHGVGVCWDEREVGECLDEDCPYAHHGYHSNGRPQSTMQMNFGKYEGRLIHNVPINYIRWLKKENVLDTKDDEFAEEVRRVWSNVFQ